VRVLAIGPSNKIKLTTASSCGVLHQGISDYVARQKNIQLMALALNLQF
jgi:hypothetical protein